MFEDVTQRIPRGDPHLLQGLRGRVIADRLGALAVDRDERAIDGADDIGDRDLVRRLRQLPAPGFAADGGEYPDATKIGEDRLEEALGDVLPPAELIGADGFTVVDAGDLDESAQRIVGLGGDPHAVIVAVDPPSQMADQR